MDGEFYAERILKVILFEINTIFQKIVILHGFVTEFEIILLVIKSVVDTAKNFADDIEHRV